MVTSFNPNIALVGIHTITYTYTNGNGCSNSANDTIFVKSTVGIPAIQIENIEIVPNPSNGSFALRYETSDVEEMSISVFDTLGQIVWNGVFDTLKGSEEIHLINVSKGVYLVRMIAGQRVLTKKIEIK